MNDAELANYLQRVIYQCRTKKLSRGEMNGLNDKKQYKQLIISDKKNIRFEPPSGSQS